MLLIAVNIFLLGLIIAVVGYYLVWALERLIEVYAKVHHEQLNKEKEKE